ncbi:MAG: hypothetical protein KA369_05970 [Spirochaetes bacterium]|nr:hypothetical protein [Spirochaetota bacterium]
MKKQGSLFCAITLMTALMFASASLAGAPLKYEWGTQLLKVKKSLPSDRESTQFTPKDKPKYKNKILSYITAIDNKLIDKIIILRIQSKPVIDYLFVNDKLYTIMENWGNVDPKTEKEIQANLTRQFGQPLVQQDRNFFIYSYNTDKTKVLCYLMKSTDGTSKCKVYYYAKQLFRMLITE